MSNQGPLAIIDTHPVQYRAPVYQMLAREFGLPVTVIYGSDFSVVGYKDREFGASFSWDVDLLSDTDSKFLARVSEGGADSFEKISWRGLGRAIDEAGPSAVLATGYSPLFNLMGVIEATRRRIPVLFRAETSDVCTRPRTSKRTFGGVTPRSIAATLLRDTTLRGLYAICERVLPIGSTSRAHYLRLGVPEVKMISSPYCVSTAPFRCEEWHRGALREPIRRELGLSGSDIAILFSGKLSERKGVRVLARAAKLLPEALRSRTVFVFLGMGAERERLEAEFACEPAVRAIFVGFRNQRELSPYYHGADLFVLPSLWGETWGLVVNEALHHGVPCVVSSAVGCAPDLVEENLTGGVAEVGSPTSLADAIARVAPMMRALETRTRCRRKVAACSTSAAATGIARAFREVTAWSSVEHLVSTGTRA